MKLYRIARWRETFETADSLRKIKAMNWFACPSGCESGGFLALAAMGERGALAFGIFMALCQGYSGKYKTHERDGAFRRSDGRPMRLAEIAQLVRFDLRLVEDAVALLTSPDVSWIETEEHEEAPAATATAPASPPSTTAPVSRPIVEAPISAPLQPDFMNAARRIVRRYMELTGKPESGPAWQACAMVLRSEEETEESLLAKVEAIGHAIAKLPAKERRFMPSAEDLFAKSYYVNPPSTFTQGRSDEPGPAPQAAKPREAWQLRQDIAQLDEQIGKIRNSTANYDFIDTYPDPEVPTYTELRKTLKESKKQELEQLTQRRKQLIDQLKATQ